LLTSLSHPFRQGGDERLDALGRERALAGFGLHEPAQGEPFHGVPDRVPGRAVLIPELEFAGELVSRSHGTGSDLLKKILGDLPVLGLSHGRLLAVWLRMSHGRDQGILLHLSQSYQPLE